MQTELRTITVKWCGRKFFASDGWRLEVRAGYEDVSLWLVAPGEQPGEDARARAIFIDPPRAKILLRGLEEALALIGHRKKASRR